MICGYVVGSFTTLGPFSPFVPAKVEGHGLSVSQDASVKWTLMEGLLFDCKLSTKLN